MIYISTLTLVFVLIVAIAIGWFASHLAQKAKTDEDILAEACDHCHWCYVLEDQAEMDAKCEQCLIGRLNR